jgi:NitT/TauT family transport system substrate-binding protein
MRAIDRARFCALAGAAALAPRIASAQSAGTLHLASLTNDTASAVLYALKTGMFSRAGIDADFLPMNSGAAASAAVAGGSAQIGQSSLVTLIEAHARGGPFVLVAAGSVITSDVPYAAALVRKDSPIQTGRDMNGKTFGVAALKDLNQLAAMAWIDQTGGDSSTVRFIEMPAVAMVTAIEEGRVDAGQVGTPALAIALDAGKTRVLAAIFDALAPRFANVAWFATQAWAGANADVVRHFAEVMRDASIAANAHHADTLALIATYVKVDPRILARMTRVEFEPYLDPREIQPLIDAAVKYKFIDQRFDARELISPLALRPR